MSQRSLSAVLELEIAEVAGFVALLREEQSLLSAGTVDRLTEIADAKAAIVERLSPLSDERNRLLGAEQLAPDAAGVDAWAAQHGPQAQKLRQELVALVAEARELNQLNGRLITMRLAHTQGALQALNRTAPGSGLYDRGGQTAARTGYRFIDSA